MQIADVTPELAAKLSKKYLAALIDQGVRSMSVEQQSIFNGLYALSELESRRAWLASSPPNCAFELAQQILRLERILTASKPTLTRWLSALVSRDDA